LFTFFHTLDLFCLSDILIDIYYSWKKLYILPTIELFLSEISIYTILIWKFSSKVELFCVDKKLVTSDISIKPDNPSFWSHSIFCPAILPKVSVFVFDLPLFLFTYLSKFLSLYYNLLYLFINLWNCFFECFSFFNFPIFFSFFREFLYDSAFFPRVSRDSTVRSSGFSSSCTFFHHSSSIFDQMIAPITGPSFAFFMRLFIRLSLDCFSSV